MGEFFSLKRQAEAGGVLPLKRRTEAGGVFSLRKRAEAVGNSFLKKSEFRQEESPPLRKAS